MRAHARPHTVGFQPFPSTCDSNRLVSKQVVHALTRPVFGAFCLARANWHSRVSCQGVRTDGNTPPLQDRKHDGAADFTLSCPSGSTCDGSAKHRVDGLEKTTASGEDLSPLGQARKSLPPALLHPVPWLQRWVGKARTRAGALAHGQSNIYARPPKKTVDH